ncbi:MAG: hypothetical protein IKH44_06755 [Bacteroidales bacterium]|nr:hypothetical protein [Bacteroidales bacterium]
MVSNSQNPYKVIEENPLDYSFVNRDGINYHLYFTPISSIYPDLLNTYSFSIEREGTNPHPIDLRIAATVVDVLRRFFETIENAMIMVCDSTDGKQHKRRNLFDRWFHFYNDGTLTTISAEVGEGDYELLLSIYFKKNNPNKQQLIKAFGDLLAKDCFEIVI